MRAPRASKQGAVTGEAGRVFIFLFHFSRHNLASINNYANSLVFKRCFVVPNIHTYPEDMLNVSESIIFTIYLDIFHWVSFKLYVL